MLNSDERCGLPYPAIYCAPDKLLEACRSLNSDRPGALLVHLSGYGYSSVGAPTRLAAALADVRASGQFRIAVYFHELFASAMPWRAGHFGSRGGNGRRSAASRRTAICWSRIHAFMQLGWNGDRSGDRQSRCNICPCSAAGEAQAPTPIADRERAVAVFGLAANRRRAYRIHPHSGTC